MRLKPAHTIDDPTASSAATSRQHLAVRSPLLHTRCVAYFIFGYVISGLHLPAFGQTLTEPAVPALEYRSSTEAQAVPAAPSTHLPHVSASDVGFAQDKLDQLERLVHEGIANGSLPGCVICIGRHGKLALLRAYGDKRIEPQREPMTTNTLFDMASITKPVATATSIMKLVEDGKIDLNAKAISYLPDFAPNGKEAISIVDLLIHQSGLIPDNPLADYLEGPELAWQRICELELVAPVGSTFKYSDVNFIVLAQLVQRVSGRAINDYAQQEIFQPLGMDSTGFLPTEPLRKLAAPTEQRDGEWIQGTVHDPRAHALGGIAGHAGLFSTAEDLAVYAQMLLSDGTLQTASGQSIRILSPETIATMTQAYPVSSGIRGLGWDKQTGYSSNRGGRLSPAAFGHGGFTGTVLWIDPELDLFFIFLSNRLHPNGNGNVNRLSGQILDTVVSALEE